jgi:dTDP-4-dehydrorhamnose reductase
MGAGRGQAHLSRVLILGGSGMLGHKMFQVLGRRFPETYATVRTSQSADLLKSVGLYDEQWVIEGIDVLDPVAMSSLVAKLHPDVIINCVGIVKQREQASDSIASIKTNSLLPHQLSGMCQETGARLIHFSTDCVFDGVKGAYTEEDVSNATDLYGRSKFLGETSANSSLTLRSSIIGRELASYDSLLEWFLAQNHGQVKGFKKALYAGITTNQMARLVGDLIEGHPELSGMYQVSGPWISKYDLLMIVRDKFNLEIEIEPDNEVAIDRTLVGDKFEAATGIKQPGWTEMIEELAADPTPYRRA